MVFGAHSHRERKRKMKMLFFLLEFGEWVLNREIVRAINCDLGTLYLNFGSDVVGFGRKERQRSKGGPFAKN